MTEEQEIALLANVKYLTDHMKMVDQVFAAARMGVDMVLVFECSESGLFYPADYGRNWGRPWGDGLGPDVCSESLQSSYDIAPPEPDRNTRSLEQIMHPLRSSKAQMDAHLVEASLAAAGKAVYAHEDETMTLRGPMLRAKQLENPASKISRLQGKSLTEATWMIKKEGGYR